MKFTSAIAASIIGLLMTHPTSAQTIEELQQQLDAQKQINELLKQRIRSLEDKLLDEQGGASNVVEQTPSYTPSPDKAAGDPEEERALERALVRRGVAVLSEGRWELAPGLQWIHSGRDALRTEADDYIATLDARIGLPGGTMIGAGVPYFIKADREFGDNSGFGDLALSIWKQFRAPSESGPSIVGSLGYRAPTGEDSKDPIPLGSEFHRLSTDLSFAKSIDPVVLSGNVFYAHAFSERIDEVKIQPGDAFGFGSAASLAITPEITGSLGLSFSFIDELERNGTKVDGSEQTIGLLDISLGFLINRRLFLSLFADIGITDDAPDLILGISTPLR